MSRVVHRIAAGILGAGLLVVTLSAAQADVDVTGRWVLRGLVLPTGADFLSAQQWTQNGAALTTSEGLTGSINPSTGAVDLSRPVGCNRTISLTASVAPDGLSVSGVYSVPDYVFCTHHGAYVNFTGSRCPSGTIQPAEGCDDGNLVDGDGCDNFCNIEPCWACAGTPSVCEPGPCEACANGVLDPGEACDDGNAFDGDGCDHTCAVEPCRFCFGEPSHCQVAPCGICGDGVVEVDEECDDGNSDGGDGCGHFCGIEECWSCNGAPSVCTAFATGAPCEADTSDCTVNGACTADHRCVETIDLSLCDDGDSCTVDKCSTGTGCYHDRITCYDFDACTIDQCVDGVCYYPALCDDGNPCTEDTCNDGSCGQVPLVRNDCRPAGASALVVGDGTGGASDTLKWTWTRGPATASDFGDPRATAGYQLCVFAGAADTPLAHTAVEPDATHWQYTSKGFRYRRRDASDPMRINLIGDTGNRAKIVLNGKGTGLNVSSLPADTPITVQLRNSQTNVCWAADYDAASIRQRNGRLSARAITP